MSACIVAAQIVMVPMAMHAGYSAAFLTLAGGCGSRFPSVFVRYAQDPAASRDDADSAP
jgi:hypothetical protein